jgi:hypothetical protein
MMKAGNVKYVLVGVAVFGCYRRVHANKGSPQVMSRQGREASGCC